MANGIVTTKVNPQVRSGLTALGTAIAASAATATWLSTHSVDIYAIFDKLNTAVGQVTAVVTTLGALYTMGMSVWNSRPSKKAADLISTGKVEGMIVNDPALAAKLGPEVQTSVQDLPLAAKAL